MAGLRYRRAVLLATAHAEGGHWSIRGAWDLYRTQGFALGRARTDLAHLACTERLLAAPGSRRVYTLTGGP